MKLVTVQDLSVEFPIYGGLFKKKVGAVRAVQEVSFTVAKGETLGIVGESGCGKTTLGRTIVRLYEPSTGSIIFKDQDITKASSGELLPLRQNIQMIFQDPYGSLNPRMNVRTILEEPLKLAKYGDETKRLARVHELMDLVGLRRDVVHRYPHEFSGGQRQRIGIARAMALNPELVVCDEAVSALDVSIQAQVINLLVDLQKKLGLTYIFVAHDLAVVHYICDRVAVMYLGRLLSLEVLVSSMRIPFIPTRKHCWRRFRQSIRGSVENSSLWQVMSRVPRVPRKAVRFTRAAPMQPMFAKTENPKMRKVAAREVACHHAERLAGGAV